MMMTVSTNCNKIICTRYILPFNPSPHNMPLKKFNSHVPNYYDYTVWQVSK